MTETTETGAPPPTTRRLPGVDRARAFSEPAPPQVSRPALSDPLPTEVVTWERFADPAAPTDLLAEGCDWIPGGWIPPAPPERPADWGRRPALVKALSFGLISPRPGREELAHRVNERLIRSATWTRSVRIAVCNPKGGSGKSPTAVVLGGVLARIRGGSVAIWDAANTPHSAAFEAVIERADILVVPTTLTADSINKALALLRRLQAAPTGLVQRAVVAVLRAGGPETPGLAAQVPSLFESAGVGAVVDIPFDRHIATGTAITLASLSHDSVVAWTRLAAVTVDNILVV